MIDEDIQRYYARGRERERLTRGSVALELVRTQELLERCLPPPPVDILDVGGGPGVYAAWLAKAGYRVHLVDPIPLHVEQATAAAAAQPDHPFTTAVGDARHLEEPDASFDVVLRWFTTAYFHQPDELVAEIAESGLDLESLIGIEGPGGFIGNGWDDPQQRPHILRAAQIVEQEPSLLGLSGHLAVARKSR